MEQDNKLTLALFGRPARDRGFDEMSGATQIHLRRCCQIAAQSQAAIPRDKFQIVEQTSQSIRRVHQDLCAAFGCHVA